MALEKLVADLNYDVWLIGKVFVLFSLLFFLAFSILVVRQAKLMTTTVTGKLDRQIKIVSWLFFIFAALVFVGSIIIL